MVFRKLENIWKIPQNKYLTEKRVTGKTEIRTLLEMNTNNVFIWLHEVCKLPK